MAYSNFTLDTVLVSQSDMILGILASMVEQKA